MGNFDNVKMIAAISLNGAIGKNGEIPWRSKEDLRWFKEQTENNVVVMGRGTWESIGKPLPNRTNVVLSKTLEKSDLPDSVELYDSVGKIPHKNIIVIGGAEIYRMFLPITNELLLTIIKEHIEGADTFFPSFNFKKFDQIKETPELIFRKYFN